MNFKNYLDSHQVIVFDLDGTIIDKNQILIDGLDAGIKCLGNKNFYMIIATGRILATIKQLTLPQQILRYFTNEIVCYDGNALFDNNNNQITFLKCIPSELFESYFKKYFKDFELVIDMGGILYANSKLAAMKFSLLYKISRKEITICDFADVDVDVDDLMLIIIFSEIKLNFYGKEDIYNRLDINFIQENIPRMKITPISCKASGVEYILKRKGLSLNDVIAFGNDINDISLLQKANVGVAVLGSDPLLIEIADIKLDKSLGDIFRI